jgi:hypothetical protein
MLTIVIVCYGQPLMMARQFETIASYGDDALDRLKLVVVDDCGKPAQEIPDELRLGMDTSLYRVTKDIPWNQPMARNLGMHEQSGPCVMLDPDMVIRRESIEGFLARAEVLKRGHVGKFVLRRVSNGKIDTSSPNTWFIHAEDFLKAGGYDEDYCGHKGWSDVQLQAVLTEFYKVHRLDSLEVDFYDSTAQITDSRVNTLNRSVAHNRTIHVRKAERAKQIGWRRWVANCQGKMLRAPWMRVH